MPRQETKEYRIFPESKLAHEILDGLEGIEIGPAAHNPFGLKTRTVGLSAENDALDYEYYEQMQRETCGAVATIDLAADAACLPLAESSVDFVLHSHVWEHLPNPLHALDEWVRVVRSGGFIFAIVPKRDADPNDRSRPVTPLAEWEEHYARKTTYEDRIAEMKGPARSHYTVFLPRSCTVSVTGSTVRIARCGSRGWLTRRRTTKWATATPSYGECAKSSLPPNDSEWREGGRLRFAARSGANRVCAHGRRHFRLVRNGACRR